jgi:hypothetical protein
MAAIIKPGRMDSVGCPGCDKLLAFNPTSAGQVIICPTCQRRVRMPTAAELRSDAPRPNPFEPRPASPYAPSRMDSDRAPSSVNYETPGRILFLLSIGCLFFDALWALLIIASLFGDNLDADAMLGFAVFAIWGFFSFAAHLLSTIAGLRMTQRRSLSLARLGAVLGLIPCGSCGILQIPFAIWALVVLFNENAARDFVD